MAEDSAQRRIEVLEESLAELLAWVMSQEAYDDQLSDETRWDRRLQAHVRPDGLAPLAPLYDDQFVRLDELPGELASLTRMVERAESLLADGRFEAALGRGRLRERVARRRSAGSPDS